MPEPAAIILAAGRSRRFGADKLLATVERNGRSLPLLGHTLATWLQVFSRVQVVVRPDGEDLMQSIQAALQLSPDAIAWVVCAEADRGMGVSLASGVRAQSAAPGWVIGLADMPAIPAAVIAQVRQAITAGAALAAPLHAGRRGHPVGFAAAYRDELLALDGDRGARELLLREQDKLYPIISDDAGVLLDIDTPADLQSLHS